MEEALDKMVCQLYLIGFENDFLFLPSEMEHIANTMRSCGKENVDYIEIKSDYGHDAFLVEIEKFDQYVRDALC